MSDPTDIVMGAGGGGVVVATLMGLLKVLGSRQVNQLDQTLKALTEAVRDLYKEVHELRMAHVGMSKDIGALQEADKQMTARIDGQAAHYRDRFESLQQQITELAKKGPKGK